MRVTSVAPFGSEELLSRVRQTPLRGFGKARPYADASIELAHASDPAVLAPAQRYVL